MSNSIGDALDLINRYQTTAASTSSVGSQSGSHRKKETPSNELSFTDMLQLMVLQFQNQTIDNTADTSDMMNQLVQMSVVQAMTSMSTQMEQLSQANVMSYAASLVGKEVTVGTRDKEGKLQEIVGVVTATGTYDGQPVIFIGDKSYLLSSIMAVGRLPERTEESGGSDGTGDTPPVENPGDTSAQGSEKEGGPDAAAYKGAGAGPDWNGQRTVG